MPKGYRHPTCAERCRIEASKGSGFSRGEIARHPGRDRSTIHREIGRNGGGRGYRHEWAQGMAEARRKAASSVPRRFTPERWAEVEEKLREGWSPERIGGRFRLEGRPVGRQRIYERVRADRKAGGDLWRTLRRRGRKPNWKGGRHSGRGHIPDRVDISERPAVVDEKGRLGDREVDTITGKAHGGALVSLVDRAAKCTLLGRVDGKTAELVGSKMIVLLDGAPEIHTITSDNGKEFAGHTHVAKAHDAEFHFAGPCHSRERGLNEHADGLVREHFPKGTDFRLVSDAEVRKAQDRLNARPGRALGYRTPTEALHGL